MPVREPPTIQSIDASEVRVQWSTLLSKVLRREARIIVEKSGILVAAVISAADLERLSRFEAERASDFAILDEIGAAFQDVPPEEIEHEVATALAEARVEKRRRHEASKTV